MKSSIVFARDEEGYSGIYVDGKCVYQYDRDIEPEHLLKILEIECKTKYVDSKWLYKKDKLPENLEDVEWEK